MIDIYFHVTAMRNHMISPIHILAEGEGGGKRQGRGVREEREKWWREERESLCYQFEG